MQKKLFLIIILFSLVSCYTYQVKKPVDTAIDTKKEPSKNVASVDATPIEMKSTKAELQKLSSQQAPAPINVQEKLVPNKNFKIDVDGKAYKIIVDRWESDSLVAHAVNNPKKILKFHKNQIDSEKIAEKRFSKPLADIITIAVYAGIGVGIWSLLQ
ncbi:hypothetical protein [Chryseobacterium balustinum]|uniref:Lipoprotein n=1 Tax=Chryseobacterium balustinum TaxID=246 RepID=A0AAX2IR76_9FLAO|nr:hypothetical protein [Chryseobacterium balustinum]AZB30955.1 hypothetical protein EB354_17770 [Chryseobacterium balustinum]SKB42266.1 hypothetical protein SAMN05421800_101610 [Chryseobacterium balustinum]SQA92169.1 Uncharacterised protein [Chryseobacterium balustinum]